MLRDSRETSCGTGPPRSAYNSSPKAYQNLPGKGLGRKEAGRCSTFTGKDIQVAVRWVLTLLENYAMPHSLHHPFKVAIVMVSNLEIRKY